MRWLHNVAAAAWIGGGVFYLLIVRPRMRKAAAAGSAVDGFGSDFAALVNTSMGVLVVTGAILTFSRVTSGFVGVPYVAVLAAKIATAVAMFYLARSLHRRSLLSSTRDGGKSGRIMRFVNSGAAVVTLGVIVLLLADVLSAIFERGLQA